MAADAHRHAGWYYYFREFLAGSFAGAGLVLAGHPFDTIKVRLQNEGSIGRFKGPVDCLLTTLREEKIRGVYKGALGPLLGQGFVSSFQFGIYNVVKPHFTTENEPQTLLQVWQTGTMTGAFMFIPSTPMEGIKARLQMQYSEQHTGTKSKYSGTFDCYKRVYRESGIRGWYHGGVPTFFCRLGFGSYILGYELARRRLAKSSESLSPIATLTAGGVAGLFYWFSTYPFDVIKNRMMADPVKYPSTSVTVRTILQHEGVTGFSRGLSVCLIRSLPANATTFLFLEIARRVLPEA